MIPHRHIRLSLYEYVRDELSTADRAAVDAHLQKCAACREELEMVRSVVENSPVSTRPSDLLPEAYWSSFSAGVASRLPEGHAWRARPSLIIRDLGILLAGRRRWALAAGGAALAIGLLMVGLWPGRTIPPAVEVADVPATPVTADQRVDQVFRRSKMLLVGLDNLRPTGDRPLDLSTERHISRGLIAETRALRNAPINPRSARVVRDLERILIELANTNDRAAMPEVEIIIDGMRQENLLFRLRMAEIGRQSAGIERVRDDRRNGEDG